MSLSSLYLDAFLAVAKTEGFSSGAAQLNITQSALSQRIKNLEEELGLTLFIRTPTGAALTESGEKLLRYCQTKNSLEVELIQDLNGSKNSEISGTIRLACYSSVLRSVIIPALRPFLQKHPQILCDFKCVDMPNLPGLLQRGEVDFIIMDYSLQKSNIESVILGQEKYVLIECGKSLERENVFLDNDSTDLATENFFKAQGIKAPKYQRSYFDDCYGIIDGVSLGLGKAVMPEYLVANNSKVKIAKGYKPYRVNIVLHHYHQPFYSKLHNQVIEQLTANCKILLQ